MPDSSPPVDSANELQFHTVEPAGNEGSAESRSRNCFLCDQPIADTYYAIADSMVCPACREQLNAPVAGTKIGRFAKASVMGLAAGLVGMIVWFAVRRLAQIEVGLIAVVVGYMVGKGVRWGSRNQGGLRYQLLAVTITYCCIAANYMPDIFEAAFSAAPENQAAADPNAPPVDPMAQAANEQQAAGDAAAAVEVDAPAANQAAKDAAAPVADERPITTGELVTALAMIAALAFLFSLAVPVLSGAENPIGLLIVGFALWEAWKFNARRPLAISGPYQLGPTPADDIAAAGESP